MNSLFKLLQRPFWVVLGGTGAAQLIGLFFSPVLTRLYAPESFGYMAIFSVTVGVLASALGLRFEFAIPAATTNLGADRLLGLLAITAILLSCVLAVSVPIMGLEIGEYAALVFPSLVAGAAFVFCTGGNNWLVRQGAFPAATFLRVLRAIAAAMFSIGLFYFTMGLVWAGALANLLAMLVTASMCAQRGWNWRACFQAGAIKESIIENFRFPLHALLPAICDSLAALIPIYWGAKLFGADDIGNWGLSRMILAGPLGMISFALAQVLMKKSLEVMESNGSIKNLVLNIAVKFSLLLLIVSLIVSMFGFEIFGFVFGKQWQNSGGLSGLLVWAFAASALCSMASITLVVLHRLVLNGIWQVVHAGGLAIIFYYYGASSFESFVRVFVFYELVLYMIYAGLIYFECQRYDRLSIQPAI